MEESKKVSVENELPKFQAFSFSVEVIKNLDDDPEPLYIVRVPTQNGFGVAVSGCRKYLDQFIDSL